jgi:hypothetical protein
LLRDSNPNVTFILKKYTKLNKMFISEHCLTYIYSLLSIILASLLRISLEFRKVFHANWTHRVVLHHLCECSTL